MICPDQKLSGQIFYYYIISPFVFYIFILFQSPNVQLSPSKLTTTFTIGNPHKT